MRSNRAIVVGGVFVGLLGLANAVWALVSVLRGEILTSLVTSGFAAFAIGLVIPLPRTLPGRVDVRGEFNAEGTTLRPDRIVDISTQVALFGGALAGVVLATFAPLGMVVVPAQARLQLPFVGGVIALVAIPTFLRGVWRGSTSYLYLSPLGFEMGEGWRTGSAQWSEVRDIGDTDPKRPRAFNGGVVAILADGSVAGMSASGYTPDGAAVRELVRFYWENPAMRDELTDGRALKRLSDSRFNA